MRDSKNIDRIFQENLKDYEVFPPNKSWSAIEGQLSGKPQRRRIPFWAKISSIAALLVLFFSVGTIYFMPENSFTKNNLAKKNKQNTVGKKDSVENLTSSPIKKETKKNIETKVIQLNPDENLVADNATKTASNAEEQNDLKEKSLSSLGLSNSEKLTFNDQNTQLKKEISESKFTVATIFAPIYFNSFGDGSGADSQFNENQTSGQASYSYGVKFSYKLNKKFSVQSGVNMISLGQTTNDVYITPGVAVVSLANVSSQPIIGASAGLGKQNIDLAKENPASLNQVFGYVEIPVELKYNVTDGKIGVNIVGGFSTLLLNKDEVFIETNSFSQSLGNSNNLRSVNFSGNFGVDVDYSIYKNLFINVSPMLKVQANTFSKSSGDIQSYYLGVYTGLNYKF